MPIRRTVLLVLDATLSGRWLIHPCQLTIRRYTALVTFVAIGLVVVSFPRPMIPFITGIALAALAILRLPRHGFRLADVATVLAILFVASMLLLPEMERTRYRTAGGRYFPRLIPARFAALVEGEQVREPF